MSEQRSLLTYFSEALDRYRADHRASSESTAQTRERPGWLRWLGRQMIPNIGTLILVAVLLVTVPSLAAPRGAPEATSTSTISYQGRLADDQGNPLTGFYSMEFRIYDDPVVGSPLWEEFWTGGNSVSVNDGLFNVMLGSISAGLPDAIQGHDELYLGITVGNDTEMVPRVQLGSVPFSIQAMTVPNGSITTAKIADGTVTTEKIVDGAVTMAKLGSDVVLSPPFEGFSYYTTWYEKSSGWLPVVADILHFNTFGPGSYDTATGTFTCPKAGYYRFMTYGFIATEGVNNERITLSVSSSPPAISGGQFSAGDTPGPHFSHVEYCNIGDQVSLIIYTPKTCVFGGTYPWWFQGEYLGEGEYPGE